MLQNSVCPISWSTFPLNTFGYSGLQDTRVLFQVTTIERIYFGVLFQIPSCFLGFFFTLHCKIELKNIKKGFFAWCLVGKQEEKKTVEWERASDALAITCHSHQMSPFRILEWDFDTKNANWEGHQGRKIIHLINWKAVNIFCKIPERGLF